MHPLPRRLRSPWFLPPTTGHPEETVMPNFFNPARHAAPWLMRALGALALLAATTVPVQAGPTLLAYSGSGNAVLFDASTGEGGWVGALDEVPDPGNPTPAALVSVVLFAFDAASGVLSGQFEFTDSADLGSALFGTLLGSTTDADPFGAGGQFAIDYTVAGGSGRFAGFSGFGLAFLNLDPAAPGDNYSESGLLVLSVPTPGTLGLALAALGVLALRGLRRHA
jgi:hypothetical protein